MGLVVLLFGLCFRFCWVTFGYLNVLVFVFPILDVWLL